MASITFESDDLNMTMNEVLVALADGDLNNVDVNISFASGPTFAGGFMITIVHELIAIDHIVEALGLDEADIVR